MKTGRRKLWTWRGKALVLSVVPRSAWASGMPHDELAAGATFALLIMSAAYWLVYRSLTRDRLRDSMVFVQIGATALAGIGVFFGIAPAFLLIAVPLAYRLIQMRRWLGLVLLVLSFAVVPVLVLLIAVLMHH